MIKCEILVPLLNANEPEARLVSIHFMDGQKVEKGATLFTIETTKATFEIEAPETGFAHLFVREGDLLQLRDRLAMITETENDPSDKLQARDRNVTVKGQAEDEKMRITKPALNLAKSLGLDLATLPTDRLVTEDIVRQTAGGTIEKDIQLPSGEKPYLLIYGGGGHAKTVIDMVKQIGVWTIAGIIDDNPEIGSQVLAIPVLGTRELLLNLFRKGAILAANGVGGVVDINIRIRIFDLLDRTGFSTPALIHPRATLEPSAKISQGVQVFANAYIGSEAILHTRCMVNTGAVVSHDCEIGAFTHIAPGALLAGEVQVGERSLLGMGVTTAIGVKIGNDVRVGNGAIILADVPDKTIVQAGRYWVGKPE